MVMAYFLSGTQDDFGNWNYFIEFCYDQFMGMYPDIQIAFHLFTQCTRIVGRFLETGMIEQKESTI